MLLIRGKINEARLLNFCLFIVHRLITYSNFQPMMLILFVNICTCATGRFSSKRNQTLLSLLSSGQFLVIRIIKTSEAPPVGLPQSINSCCVLCEKRVCWLLDKSKYTMILHMNVIPMKQSFFLTLEIQLVLFNNDGNPIFHSA